MPPTANGSPEPAKGLPPVVAPSGRFIAQLFLVPGLIVAGAVTVLLGFSWLAGGPRTPEGFVRGLESANPDVRWRTASDLAQVLLRDETLAADVPFSVKLAELLRDALDEQARMAKARAERPAGASAEVLARERTAAENQSTFIQYLTACVGRLMTPVGAPVLADMVRSPRGGDAAADALVRRQAVWALASLGERLHRLEQLPAERRAELLAQLDQQGGRLADQAAACLRGKGSAGAVPALLACAESDDQFLRAQTAHALTFWTGTPDESKRIEETLLRLARDDGRGTAIEIGGKP